MSLRSSSCDLVIDIAGPEGNGDGFSRSLIPGGGDGVSQCT